MFITGSELTGCEVITAGATAKKARVEEAAVELAVVMDSGRL